MSVPAAPLLSVEGLEVTFGTDAPAVCGVDLAVRSGQTVAVVGESGSGKSTTAAAILGLLPAGGRITAGRVVFDGRDITGADAKRLRSIRGREIGYVPQDPMTNLNPVWKVGFQVTEALRANTDGRAARRRAVELLAEAGLPDPAKQAGRYPHQLSGGMCQRALIAIGLAGRPRLLIADEPTSALDVTVQRQVLDHLQGLTDELGTALLLITHDLALAAQRAEAVVVVRRGVVVESGAAQSILQSPQHEYTRRLVAAAPSLTARSRRPPESRSRATTQAGDILVVSELTKIYRESRGAPWRRVESRAVDGVSFRLPRASTLAIVGESGSGKSTLARMVLGLLQPTSGTVVFDGTYDVGALARDQVLAFRRRVQPVFQNPYSSLDPMYSVFRAIEEPLRVHHVGDRRQRQRAVRELVDQVALPSSILGRRPRELSGGQRQRVAIARALALRPEVLVCDEAVSALDVLVQAQILDLLADLQADLGLTYLFISHDLAVIRQIADDVLVMRAGRVVEHASTEEVFSRPRHEYTRQLLQAIPGAPSAPPKGWQPVTVDPLAPLMELPGVAAASDRVRDALSRVHRHRANLRGWPVAAAEASLRAARASSVLDGGPARLHDAGAPTSGKPALSDPVFAGALRVGQALEGGAGPVVGVWRRAPLQALARLHMLAAADQVDDDRLGRPRSDADVGPRLELLADVVTHPTLASAPVVAAVAHGELLTLRPFGCADGVVARAVSRLVTIATGLDPHGLGVPEVIWMRQPAEYHDAARRFAGGTPDGVAGWLLLCCGAMLDGAREALSIAESLSPG